MPEQIEITPESMDRMRNWVAMKNLQEQLGRTQQTIPAGPFAEFIKRIAHYGQIPACKTCIHFTDGYNCTQSDDWHEKKPTGFCEEWNPEQPGEKTNR